MGRICAGLLATFRVIQFLCSLVAVGCGIFITYEMKSMSDSAHDLELSIQKLQDDPAERSTLVQTFKLSENDVKSAIDTLSAVLDPVLHVLQGTPVRAIIISIAGIWSLLVITYMFFAQRSENHPRANKRSTRILLELLTLLFWIAGIICSILLAVEYGFITVVGGDEVEAAIVTSRQVLEQVLKEIVQDVVTNASSKIADVLGIVGNIVTVGAVAITSVVVSGACFHVSVVSLIVAFCMKGSKDNGYRGSAERALPGTTPMLAQYENKSPVLYVTETNSSWQTPVTPATPCHESGKGNKVSWKDYTVGWRRKGNAET